MRLDVKKILVPVTSADDKEAELAKNAVEAACDVARAFSAKLHIVTAVPPPVPATGPDFSGEIYKSLLEVRNAQIRAARDFVDGLKATAAEGDVQASVQVLDGTDSVAQQICRHADDAAVDLIAIPTHGRKGIRHLLLGSVAERVAHLSPVPVLLLRTRPEK